MSLNRLWKAVGLCVVVVARLASDGLAEEPDLDKGHRLLIQRGLQVQATVMWPFNGAPTQPLDWDLWRTAHFTGICNGDIVTIGLPADIQWGRWRDGATWTYDLTESEEPFAPRCVNWLGPDEVELDDPAVRESVSNWFANARGTGHFTDTLLSVSQYGKDGSMGATATSMQTFMAESRPDMLFFQQYPWRTESGQVGVGGSTGNSFYTGLLKYRWLSLQGNDGTGDTPIPYGWHGQCFSSSESFSIWKRYPSASEMRLEAFAGWTFGAKMLIWFMYTTYQYEPPSVEPAINSVLFEEGTITDEQPTAAFAQLAELNRQSRNLGKSLVCLVSTEARVVPGQYMLEGEPTPIPLQTTQDTEYHAEFDVQAWANSVDPYIESITATNLGTKNDGLPGEVLVGYFTPLRESWDGAEYENQIYFLITNGLSDPDGTPEETQQQIRLDFDFGESGITGLQRLSRDTGEVGPVALAHDGGSLYHLDLTLDGGTGDLFKFDTGAPFVTDELTGLLASEDATGSCFVSR